MVSRNGAYTVRSARHDAPEPSEAFHGLQHSHPLKGNSIMERRYYVEVAGSGGEPDLQAKAFIRSLQQSGFAVKRADSIELPGGEGRSLLETATADIPPAKPESGRGG